jgi:hypothetical protein
MPIRAILLARALEHKRALGPKRWASNEDH